jgi:hypothetical protein
MTETKEDAFSRSTPSNCAELRKPSAECSLRVVVDQSMKRGRSAATSSKVW